MISAQKRFEELCEEARPITEVKLVDAGFRGVPLSIMSTDQLQYVAITLIDLSRYMAEHADAQIERYKALLEEEKEKSSAPKRYWLVAILVLSLLQSFLFIAVRLGWIK